MLPATNSWSLQTKWLQKRPNCTLYIHINGCNHIKVLQHINSISYFRRFYTKLTNIIGKYHVYFKLFHHIFSCYLILKLLSVLVRTIPITKKCILLVYFIYVVRLALYYVQVYIMACFYIATPIF